MVAASLTGCWSEVQSTSSSPQREQTAPSSDWKLDDLSLQETLHCDRSSSKTHRQTDKPTDKPTDMQADRQRGTYRQVYMTDRESGRHVSKQVGRQTDNQTEAYRQTGRQMDKQTDIHTGIQHTNKQETFAHVYSIHLWIRHTYTYMHYVRLSVCRCL